MKQKKFNDTVKTFRDSFSEDLLSEYPLDFFSEWYKTINEFSAVLKNLKYMEDDGTTVVWDYRLLVLNPSANPDTTSNKTKRKKMEWASDLAVKFLNSVFDTNIDDRECIGAAVLQDFTLMIVACKMTSKGKQPPKPLHTMYNAKVRNEVMVLGAACFRHGSKKEVGMGFVSWLAVATAANGYWSFLFNPDHQTSHHGLAAL